MEAKKGAPECHREVLVTTHHLHRYTWVFWDGEDLNLNYFLGKTPSASQEGHEPEEIAKLCYYSDMEKENASVL